MANNLTGDFEGVVEVSVRQINGLLATLHQSGVDEHASRPLLHSAVIRIGDVRRPPPIVGDFGNWVLEYQKARGPLGLGDLRNHLTVNAPPGAAKLIDQVLTQLGEVVPDAPPDTVRGTARLQLSSLTISLPLGSTTEVTVHGSVRAHYFPDPGTTDLPKPIHGEVQGTCEVRQTMSAAGRRLIVQPSADDNKIQFIPAAGSGLSAGDVAKISAQVRKALRDSFPILPVDLPAGFPFTAFKGVGSGPGQAIALPLQLSGATPPPSGTQGINNVFTGPAGFAFAVSKDFIKAQFQRLIDNLLQFKQDFKIKVGPLTVATYHASVTSADLQFNNGSIDFVVKGKATHPIWWDYNFTIKQRITLVLLFDMLFIAAPDDQLTISGLPGGATDRVRVAVTAQRNAALPPAQDALNQKLGDARAKLNSALHSFDPSMSASFRAGQSEEPNAGASGAVAITPDGVIVRGDIASTAPRYGPIMDIAETQQGQAFSALKSWIPGGVIQRLTWSWVEYTGPTIWSGVEKSFTDEHRFIFPKPPGITNASSICLRIQGMQTNQQGFALSVAGGTTCHLFDNGGVLEVPSWWEPVTVPVWLPGATADAPLKEFIAGHVNVPTDTPRTEALPHNVLVHFADWGVDKPLEVLNQALGQMQRKFLPLLVIVVLPAGTFDSRRREVEARLGSLSERLPACVLPTEDNESSWTRTFAVSKTPSTYLINVRRELVWKHEGQAEADVLAGALDNHLLPSPVPHPPGLRLAVAPGDRVPDVLFADDRGNHIRLRRLRGRAVLLNFWQAWSAPSIKELARLERLHKEGGGQAPFIVAFHGGKERTTLGHVRKQHGVSFVLTHDEEQRVARIYGVRCWPTTISVNPDGLIDHVQLGITHEHAAPAKGKADAY